MCGQDAHTTAGGTPALHAHTTAGGTPALQVHSRTLRNRKAFAITETELEITDHHVKRATEAARVIVLPPDRQILHNIPRTFIVDGQEGVKDPLGMSALRLEVETHIVTASATAVQNLSKCVAQAGVKIDELVAGSLAGSPRQAPSLVVRVR